MRGERRTRSSCILASLEGIWKVALLGLVAGMALLPLHGRAQDCTVECEVILPKPNFVSSSQYVSFQASRTPSGPCCTITADWDFGDGKHASQWSSDHYYAQPGTYTWTLSVWDSCYTTAPRCAKTGVVTVLPSTCQITCSASVASVNQATLTAQFQASGSSTGCGGSYDVYYRWDFGDGEITAPTTSPNATHTYAAPGKYYWTLYALLGSANTSVTCTRTGSVQLGCEGLDVGLLKICADTVDKSPTEDLYTLSGNVRINDALWCTGNMVFRGVPSSGVGTLTTDGNLYVVLAGRGNTNVLTGPEISYQVDGNNSRMTLNPNVLHSFYSFTLQDVSLYTEFSSLLFTQAGLKVNPLLYVGDRLTFALAALRPTVVLPPGGTIRVESCEVVAGALQPNYVLSDPLLTYEGGVLGGTIAVNYPVLGPWTMLSSPAASGACIDRMVPSDPLPGPTTLLAPELKLGSAQSTLENICNGPEGVPKFRAVLGGSLYDEFMGVHKFELKNAELVYQPNLVERSVKAVFRLRKGEASVPAGNVVFGGGQILVGETVYGLEGQGTFKGSDIFDGRFENFSLVPWRTAGARIYEQKTKYRGDVTIRRGLVIGDRADTSALVAYLKLAYGATPSVTLKNMAMKGSMKLMLDSWTWYGLYAGHWMLGPFEVTSHVSWNDVAPPRVVLLMGNVDLSNPRTARANHSGEAAVEHTIAVPVQRDWVAFVVQGTTAVPSIYLRTPSGETITPANFQDHPGVTYIAGDEEKVACFHVASTPAGTWTLGEDNLPESEVTFGAYAQDPPPVPSFGGVTQSGESVAVTVNLSQPRPDSTVSIYYGTSGGSVSGIVAPDLPAASGVVQTTWDTTSLDDGNYYLTAVSEDGVNLPAEVVHGQPVVIDRGGPEPPSGLSGSVAGAVATLTWTPSPSPSVAGYAVLYTDDPGIAGHKWEEVVPGTDQATIEALDPSKNYRFSIVAADGQGRTSSESGPWATSVCQVSTAPTATSAAGVGQPATFVANASSEHCQSALTHDWDFGDGTAHSSATDPTHTYASPGVYRWTLVASSGGSSATAGGEIHISEGRTCSLSCSANVPASGKVGEAVAFAAEAAPDWCMGEVMYAWDFGDGTPAGSAAAEPHVYASAGTYTWTLVTSIGGNRCARTGILTVAPGLPGDCDGDGQVSIGEVQKAINMFLGSIPPDCGVDCSGDGSVSIGEVQKVINAFLGVASSC